MKKTVKIEAELHAYVKAEAATLRMSVEEYVSDILNVAIVKSVEKELRAERPAKRRKEKA